MEVIERPSVNKNKYPIPHLPIALLALFVVFFYPTLKDLFSRWIKWDESLSHGLLVNSVFVYLIYKSPEWRVQQNSKIISFAVLLGLGICSLCWFFFRAANIYILEQSMLLILLSGLYAACYGIKTVFTLRLLLLLPIFTIPVWDQLTTPLVNLSGFVVGNMVQLIALPAVIEGNSIFIPYGQIVIADGCSGLRYFEIALALAYIISLLNNYKESKLLVALLIAAALGLVANWIRIFILVLIGYESKMESSLMSNHEYFGWMLFGIMSLPAIYWAPVNKSIAKVYAKENAGNPKLILPICILALGPLFNLFTASAPSPQEFKKVLSPNSELTTERKMPLPISSPAGSFKENALFERDNLQIYVQIDQYQRTTEADKLVPYIPKLYNSDEWLVISSATKSLQGKNVKLTTLRRKASDVKVVQLQWFVVGGYTATSVTVAKFLQIPALINGANSFNIITLQSFCENTDCTAVGEALLNNATDVFANSTQQ
jgi:exosortase